MAKREREKNACNYHIDKFSFEWDALEIDGLFCLKKKSSKRGNNVYTDAGRGIQGRTAGRRDVNEELEDLYIVILYSTEGDRYLEVISGLEIHWRG